MANPNQPQPASAPYPAPNAAAPKKSNAWKWILGSLGVLVLLCGGGFAACSVLVGKGINDAVEEGAAKDKSLAEANKKSCEGKTYPDQQPNNDRCADAAGMVALEGIKVAATSLKRSKDSLCASVSYENTSKETISFNVFDWKLQMPTGEVKDAFDSGINAGSSLGSGDLVTGGKKTGSVCYDAAGNGQFILIYKPSFWNDGRGIWVNSL